MSKIKKNFSNVKLEIGGHSVEVYGEYEFSVDREYGADADGRRGCTRTTVEDIRIDDVYVVDENGDKKAWKWEEICKEHQEEILELLNSRLL